MLLSRFVHSYTAYMMQRITCYAYIYDLHSYHIFFLNCNTNIKVMLLMYAAKLLNTSNVLYSTVRISLFRHPLIIFIHWVLGGGTLNHKDMQLQFCQV